MRRLMKIAPRALSVLMLATFAVAGMAATAFAQDGRAQLELRVVAQPLPDGRIEFGVEYQGERVLPTARYLTQRLIQQRRGQWLKSTPIEVVGPSLEPPALAGGDGAESPLYRDQNNLWEMRGFGRPVEQVMVAAQPLADGRIEFAIEHDGERIQPDARYLTPQLIADRQEEWLRSSPVVISAAVTPAERVRGVSADKSQIEFDGRYPLPVDVAAVCLLESVVIADIPASESTSVSRWTWRPSHLPWVAREEWHAGGQVLVRADEDPRQSHNTEAPAGRYGFIVQDPQWRAPDIWWEAEFNCAPEEPDTAPDDANLG